MEDKKDAGPGQLESDVARIQGSLTSLPWLWRMWFVLFVFFLSGGGVFVWQNQNFILQIHKVDLSIGELTSKFDLSISELKNDIRRNRDRLEAVAQLSPRGR